MEDWLYEGLRSGIDFQHERGILEEPFSMRPFGPTNSFGQEMLEYLPECEGKEKECQHPGFLSVYAAAPRFSVLD